MAGSKYADYIVFSLGFFYSFFLKSNFYIPSVAVKPTDFTTMFYFSVGKFSTGRGESSRSFDVGMIKTGIGSS